MCCLSAQIPALIQSNCDWQPLEIHSITKTPPVGKTNAEWKLRKKNKVFPIPTMKICEFKRQKYLYSTRQTKKRDTQLRTTLNSNSNKKPWTTRERKNHTNYFFPIFSGKIIKNCKLFKGESSKFQTLQPNNPKTPKEKRKQIKFK